GGRFVLGLGAGDAASRREEERFGVRVDGERIGLIEETIARVRADDLPVVPSVTPPPIWIGGRSDALLELAAITADGWHGWGLTPDRFAEGARRVRAL